MEFTRDQKLFLAGVRAGVQELDSRSFDMLASDLWPDVRLHYERAVAELEPTGNGESPAAPAIRELAAKAGEVLTSNTEPPKWQRRKKQ